MIFNDNGNITTIELEHELVGYDAIDFNLNQEEDRYGRDWWFAGNGMIKLELTKHSNYDAFVKFEELYEKYGFEADIKFRVTDGTESFIGNVDLLGIEYNGHDVFKFNVNQETEEALVKKRTDMPINIFGSEDLDGNFSQPVFPQSMLLPAKQIFRESVWENREGNKVVDFASIGAGNAFNYSNATPKSEIKNSLSWINNGFTNGWQGALKCTLIEAKTDLLDLSFDVDFDGSKIVFDGSGGNTARAGLVIVCVYGPKPTSQAEFNNMNVFNIVPQMSFVGGQSKTVNLNNTSFKLPIIKTGEVVLVYMVCDYFGISPVFHYNNIKFTAKAYEQTFDVISPCVSVYDAAKKVVKDISGLDIVFPLAQSGVLKNNFIFSGNMVRGINKPFNLSFDDLKKWFPELDLDYEIMENKQIYIGKREDYYTDNEIDAIDNVAFDSYMETQNQRYGLNKFNYKYSKYQSQKENTEENTNDIVHGEAEYHINNKQVEAVKNIEVGFVRDPFMLQETINAALTETESKATQDDDTVFIIDADTMKTADYNKAKTSVLMHQVKDGNSLTLANDGSFRWDLLGFTLGSVFQILTNENKGTYHVTDITATVIELNPWGLNPNPTYSGEVFTSFKYVIDKTIVKWKPYFFNSLIIGGGAVVENIKSPETYANLRFSVGLNIRNYYKDFISTAIKNGIPAKQLKYINNDKYINNAYNPVHVENADIEIVTPILDTKIVETKLIMPFERYMRICKVLRSQSRGFIRTFNPKAEPIYIYPQFTTAIYKSSGLKEVKVKGELKNIPDAINITKANGFYNIWIHKFQTFQIRIEGDYLIFLDPNGIPFYKKSHYSNIKVNGVNYASAQSVLNAVNAL